MDHKHTLMTLFTQHIEAILGDAAHHGALRDPRVAELARLFVGAMKAHNQWSLETDHPLDPDFIVDTFLHGLVGEKAKAS